MPLAKPDMNGLTETNYKREDIPLPISPESLRILLIQLLASNYREKFGKRHVEEKNIFSVSALVSGPGSCFSQIKRTLAGVDPVTGEEAKTFNMAMFRGSSIHKYAEQKLPDWYAYEKFHIEETIPYDWQDGKTKNIIIRGHPDFVHYGQLKYGETIYCADYNASIVVELKTVSSNEDDVVKRNKYVDLVIKKAKRQVGCYAKMLSHELKRHHFAYVVIFDDEPLRHPITEEDKKSGFIVINGGDTQLPLDEKMLKRGYVADSALRVFGLTDDEAWHGYNYVRWCAREVAKMLEDDEAGRTPVEDTPHFGPLGKQS